MIDIHCHILPGIDDGSRTIEESIDIIKKAIDNGVTDIIVTPHYMLGTDYILNNNGKKKVLERLKKYIKVNNLDINVYLGNEVFVENNMPILHKEEEITTLNDSKYLLFELPMNYKFNGLNDVIFNLGCKGYKPVIAHPERYSFIKENPSLAIDLIDKGVLFQSNIGSFLGAYGKKAKETAITLLKHGAISFIASDIHHNTHDFYDRIEECKEIMHKYIQAEEIEDLFINNPKKILNNDIINTPKCTPIKKSIFGKWK